MSYMRASQRRLLVLVPPSTRPRRTEGVRRETLPARPVDTTKLRFSRMAAPRQHSSRQSVVSPIQGIAAWILGGEPVVNTRTMFSVFDKGRFRGNPDAAPFTFCLMLRLPATPTSSRGSARKLLASTPITGDTTFRTENTPFRGSSIGRADAC
jgi:hypothetical protein